MSQQRRRARRSDTEAALVGGIADGAIRGVEAGEAELLPSDSTSNTERPGAALDRIVGNLVNAGVTTWITTATGSAESGAALGGMAGPLAEELSFAARRALSFQQARGQSMIEKAAAAVSEPTDAVLAALLESPAKVELLVRSLEASAHATTEAKLDLIAQLLATGALTQDQAVVDEQLLALDVIRDLETPHFRLMLVIQGRSPVWWDTHEDRITLRHAWPEERIVERDPGLRNALTALTAKLQSLGLAREVGTRSGKEILWELTPFGSVCIEAMNERSRAIVNDSEVGGKDL
ncbi:hypothetical protein [Micromonospora sp. SL4-19]|uniref:hypothetical protein n=1 Tax=Micromonospora sp. SL4-19 TaxID=3399129 RepID=UPI003A4DAAB8